MRLQGQVALVTGAASGIGRAVAGRFAKEGAAVMVADMNAAGAEAVAAAITASGGQARGIALDVTVKASIDAAIAATRAAFGPTTILVNSAGTAREVPLESTDEALFRKLFEVNLLGTFLCAQAAAAEMVAHGGGSIINIGSITGLHGGHPNLLYPTAKGAIINLTRTLAGQLGKDRIRVNCVAPGFVYTPTVYSRGLPEGVREMRIESSPLKTEGTGWDVGYGVLYLASDEARWVTGVVLPIDAGVSAISPHFSVSAKRLS